MKAGEAVFLYQEPKLRGNISRVTDEHVYITWHQYVLDVPDCLERDSKVNVREARRRMRVRYRRDEMRYIGIGVPES